MFQAKLIAVAIALTAPVAVAAKDAPVVKAPAATAAAATTAAGRGTVRADKADTVRYCIKDTVTGSRIARKECRTRSDWMARGFDPLEAK